MNDDQYRVRRIMTAVLANDFDVARQEIAEAPDLAHLVETFAMFLKPVLAVVAQTQDLSAEAWWMALMTYMEAQE